MIDAVGPYRCAAYHASSSPTSKGEISMHMGRVADGFCVASAEALVTSPWSRCKSVKEEVEDVTEEEVEDDVDVKQVPVNVDTGEGPIASW